MITHLALLRGIIRSQHDKNGCIKTTLEKHFTKVQTYIQSGNVFVTTEEENAAKVGFIIKQELFKVFEVMCR
jgi:uncharacterized protein (DUF1697 family)